MGFACSSGCVLFHLLREATCLILRTISGPEAASYLQALTSFDLTELTFGKSAFVPIEGFNLHVARGGYTGEDGFEVPFQSMIFLLAES